jgi:uncharacterized protein (DUF697 family)/energy-coupling factor transporter ATP-binding protein EcfA2
MFSAFKRIFNPKKNPNVKQAFEYHDTHLPTLWLLGNTGAGKSSLIQALTGEDKAEIGNGFQPCTMTSEAYEYPPNKPLLRFLDTRGLAEAEYDPSEDIKQCTTQSHALIVVMKAEEPEQSAIVKALKTIKKDIKKHQILIVHTALFQVPSEERVKAVAYNQSQIETSWGESLDSIQVDFEADDGSSFGVDDLKQRLAEMLPIISAFSENKVHSSIEEENFLQLRKEVFWYSGAASASDAIPGVGLISVPTIQAKMLHSLANQYGIEWNISEFLEFTGTLGTGFGIQYLAKLGIREAVKFVPVYGQTAGTAAAVVMSFCSTYAIGRVACKYMYHKSKGETVSKEEMQAMYRSAFDSVKEVAKIETYKK